MQEVAMCRVQFDQIKTGLARQCNGVAEIVNDARISLVSKARGSEQGTRTQWPFSSRTVVRVSAAIADGATGG